jgi:probable phosphoglycerate mutase
MFDALFVSPLRRATETADIIARGMELQPTYLPQLREVDLYSFQGLLKAEVGFRT